ncbi:MAG: hypothetical protein DWQ01_20420 [Planctomycetota bacterium]|nr:MAG: hypothetical protein DWQ01_20420 [Planctomycetota bacterium]
MRASLVWSIPCSVLAGLIFTGCQSRVPGTLVELYDRAAPDGVIEIELQRDGSIIEMEAEVPVSQLPETVLAAAQAEMPEAQVTGAELEYQGRDRVWEVKLRYLDRDHELVIDDAGNLLEFERELGWDEAPPEVLEGANLAIQGGNPVSVEILGILQESGEYENLYHVKLDRDGARYKVELSPNGEVLRKVREARAEIEIPLAE